MELLKSITEKFVWEDYYDLDAVVHTAVDLKSQMSDEEGWETVGKTEEAPLPLMEKRPPRWCKDGNTCQWKTCVFRHEKCSFGARCRSWQNDKGNTKTPENGGCPYDHRDHSKLITLVPRVFANEADMWEMFWDHGLDARTSSIVDVSSMSTNARAALYSCLEMTLDAGVITELELDGVKTTKNVYMSGWEVDYEEVSSPAKCIGMMTEVAREHEKAAAEGKILYFDAKTLDIFEESLAMMTKLNAEAAAEKKKAKEEEWKIHDNTVADKFSSWRNSDSVPTDAQTLGGGNKAFGDWRVASKSNSGSAWTNAAFGKPKPKP